MAIEQDWALYANQSVLNDTDTILARTAAGAGVEIAGSALVKKDASGNTQIGGADWTGGFARIASTVTGTSGARGISGYHSGSTLGSVFLARVDSASVKLHEFYFGVSTQVGSITTSGSATAYNTTSDRRLKENIVDADAAGDIIDAIQVRQFDWKTNHLREPYGMIAQELVEVVPQAVYQPEDPDQFMAIDYSKLVPLLIKEVQSLRARIAVLEARP